MSLLITSAEPRLDTMQACIKPNHSRRISEQEHINKTDVTCLVSLLPYTIKAALFKAVTLDETKECECNCCHPNKSFHHVIPDQTPTVLNEGTAAPALCHYLSHWHVIVKPKCHPNISFIECNYLFHQNQAVHGDQALCEFTCASSHCL